MSLATRTMGTTLTKKKANDEQEDLKIANLTSIGEIEGDHDFDDFGGFGNSLRSRHGRKFCVSDLRQSQKWHENNVHTWGRYPLTTPVPGGWMVCAPLAA